MTRLFGTEAFENLTALWENQTSDPNTLSTVGGLGSVWDRAGTYPATPTELYFKLNAANVAGNRGWVKQNLANLNVYNVTKAPFNADNTGVADCRVAVQAAVTAAGLTNGGIIYFPPGTYLFNKNPTPGAVAIIAVNNKSNIVFMGDGYNTLLKVSGDFALAGQWLFEMRNQSKRITFYNFRLNGAGVTNPNPAAQNHFIQWSDAAGTDVAPPTDGEVKQVWFEPIIGDGVRCVGDVAGLADRIIKDIRVRYCMFNMDNGVNGARSNIECSRSGDKFQVHYNWMAGISGGGQNIDFEPGGTAPNAWSIMGNIIATSTPVAVTLSGVDTPVRVPATKNLFARNILTATPAGATLEAVANPTNLLVRGNILTVAGSTPGFNTIELRNLMRSSIVENIVYSLDNVSPRAAIWVYADNPLTPEEVLVADNVCGCVSDATNVVGLRFDSIPRLIVRNNSLFMNCAASAGCVGLTARSVNIAGVDWLLLGNMLIATAGTFSRGVSILADPNPVSNVAVNDNLIHTSASGVVFDTAIAAITQVIANGNAVSGATVAVVTPPSTTNIGSRIAGTQGGSNFSQVGTLPATACAAPVGSVGLDTAGGADTALFVKESGTGTAGWIADGAVQLTFGAQTLTTATASRFLGPGMGLPTETATEIKTPIDRPGTVRNGRMKCIAGTGGTTVSMFVRNNGADTSLQLATNNTTAQATFNGGTFIAAAGDLLGVRITKGTAPTTPQTFMSVTMEITS